MTLQNITVLLRFHLPEHGPIKGSHVGPHRREAVQVRPLRQEFHPEDQPRVPHEGPQRDAAELRVPAMREALCVLQ